MNINEMSVIEINSSENKVNLIELAPLSKRIEWAKEGIFLDLLHKDESEQVRLEVANLGSFNYLEKLKDDVSTKVRIAVMKKTNYAFLEFKNINEENIEIIEEAINLGVDIKTLNFKENDLIRLSILKNKGFLYCKENNILKDLDKETEEIQKIMIEEGAMLNKVYVKGNLGKKYIIKKDKEYINNFFATTGYDVAVLKEVILCNYSPFDLEEKKDYDYLFKDEVFLEKCIEKGLYLEKILSLFYDKPRVIKLFLKLRYYNVYLNNKYHSCYFINYVEKIMNVEFATIIYENDIDVFNSKKSISNEIKEEVIKLKNNNYTDKKILSL